MQYLQRRARVDDRADRCGHGSRGSHPGDAVRGRAAAWRRCASRTCSRWILASGKPSAWAISRSSRGSIFYNLTNEATVTNWLTQLGTTYHRASTIQAGRMIKVGFNFEF